MNRLTSVVTFGVLFLLVAPSAGLKSNPGSPPIAFVNPPPTEVPFGITRQHPKIVPAAAAPNDDDKQGVTAAFNGGKMSHLFPFDPNTHKYKSDGGFTSPDAREALLGGALYNKIDGSNGMIQVIRTGDKSPTLNVFERRDTQGKGDTTAEGKLTPLPAGKNPTKYTSRQKAHTYFYNQITTNVSGKKTLKRNSAMLELAERHKDKLLSFGKEWISVEWVGRKFNGTPGVNQDVAMAIHEEQLLPPGASVERTYEGVRKYLLEECAERPIEGLVVAHEGVYWKVKTGGFEMPKGVKDPYTTNKESAKPPLFLQ